ncbi:unnamed protein product [Macrosiphum euphorbiae]|uniref:MADF domain-containing protein n=1 Tax=Macrosiphum euphorbiae TaxID=13131 RepID=A0AAV0WIK2_9HEMI|nr:unnamed protein product [Macrosiphum euphorbiae]
MEWSKEQIAQFLELYEGEPSIWNPSDANHKIQNHVHDAWGRISKNLSGAEYSISELKKKKKRFTYWDLQKIVIEGQG